MRCPNCNTELMPGTMFCPECGYQIQQSINSRVMPPPQPPQQKQEKTSTPLIIAVSVLATLLIVGVAFLLFNSNDKTTPAIATPTSTTSTTTATVTNQSTNLQTASVATLREMLLAKPFDHDIIEAWLPHLQNESLTASDFAGLPHSQMRLLRNAIYAWHGYSFQMQDLRDFFMQYSWYTPQYSQYEAANMMNSTEIKNAALIKRIE